MSYQISLPAFDITLEADRLRRDRHELIGELTVRCGLPGTRTVNGCLSVGDFNFSSVRARSERAKLLSQRANMEELDWFTVLEDLCQKVVEAEKQGQPAVDLRELPRPEPADDIQVEGLRFPRRHPSVLFGDGGSAKSYTALYLVGQLARKQMNVALFDWELAGEDHRDRLERLFGADMPRIMYARCERPLTVEADRLRRIVREHQIEYAVFDSIAFACDGRPEDAEVAGRYFRAVREIGCGSLHIAHVNKSDDNDRKPFGSAFWANGARSTWFVQSVEQSGDDQTLRLGFFNRKANLSRLHSPVSFVINFTELRTEFLPATLTDSPVLAEKLSVSQRMFQLLRRGSMPIEEIARKLEAKEETVDRTARRYPQRFIVLTGGRVGLVQK